MSHGVRIRLLQPEEPTPQLEPPNFVYNHPRGGRFEYRINGLSGGHLLHLAVAGCVFNGIVRVARERGIVLTQAVVAADGGFNEEGTRSTGISYRIEVQGEASEQDLADLVDFVQRGSITQSPRPFVCPPESLVPHHRSREEEEPGAAWISVESAMPCPALAPGVS